MKHQERKRNLIQVVQLLLQDCKGNVLLWKLLLQTDRVNVLFNGYSNRKKNQFAMFIDTMSTANNVAWALVFLLVT